MIRTMPIVRLLQNSAFDPEAVALITSAFEKTCKELQLVDRSDPLTDLVARTIIKIAQAGERDPQRMRELALKELRSTQVV